MIRTPDGEAYDKLVLLNLVAEAERREGGDTEILIRRVRRVRSPAQTGIDPRPIIAESYSVQGPEAQPCGAAGQARRRDATVEANRHSVRGGDNVAHADDLEIVHESERQEEARIRFLESERGRDEALAFARQTLGLYRRAVVTRTPPAGDTAFRLRLLGSCCYLKRYLHSRGA